MPAGWGEALGFRPMSTRPLNTAWVGDYPPRRCGIATFTHSLRNAVASVRPQWRGDVVSVSDASLGEAYPPEVAFEIPEENPDAYLRAADFLNVADTDVVSLQHEFGIFGGEAGAHVLTLLRKLRMPIVTTLHTVLESPSAAQRRVLSEIAALSSRVVVMTHTGARILSGTLDLPPGKIHVIPHGIPDGPFVETGVFKSRLGFEGRSMMLTFGLLSPGKGIAYAIRALPKIVREVPDVLYVVLGATHPRLLRENGDRHRQELIDLSRQLGVAEHVAFVNRYVDERELMEFIGAADVYVTPYVNACQVVSGTLAYCFGSGKAVVSTPYWHAEELLSGGRGELVPFRDANELARVIKNLFQNPDRREFMRRNAHALGREMTWERVAGAYAEVFSEVGRRGSPSRSPRPESISLKPLPRPSFAHLRRMSDSCGLFQHAKFGIPWFEHGYCTDDNARALLLFAQLPDRLVEEEALDGIRSACAAFVHHAFEGEIRRFRNFMGFDRRWQEAHGSEDSHARAIWALGALVGRNPASALRRWAAMLFQQAIPVTESFTSPRAWAFCLLGLHEYFRTLHGDVGAERLRAIFRDRLLEAYRQNASADWPWPEDIVAYDNARLPQALILAGRFSDSPEALQTGLSSLRWLMNHQTGGGGEFQPVGSNGFWRRGAKPALNDQQPVEAGATVSACLEAYRATEDSSWESEAQRAFDWFLGRNSVRQPLYDPSTGGCFDGLHDHRVNRNQGAESLLSWLLALMEMRTHREASSKS